MDALRNATGPQTSDYVKNYKAVGDPLLDTVIKAMRDADAVTLRGVADQLTEFSELTTAAYKTAAASITPDAARLYSWPHQTGSKTENFTGVLPPTLRTEGGVTVKLVEKEYLGHEVTGTRTTGPEQNGVPGRLNENRFNAAPLGRLDARLKDLVDNVNTLLYGLAAGAPGTIGAAAQSAIQGSSEAEGSFKASGVKVFGVGAFDASGQSHAQSSFSGWSTDTANLAFKLAREAKAQIATAYLQKEESTDVSSYAQVAYRVGPDQKAVHYNWDGTHHPFRHSLEQPYPPVERHTVATVQLAAPRMGVSDV